MSDTFHAIRVSKSDAGQKTDFVDITLADLMEGDVTVAVDYSTVNYKDGLAVTGKSRLKNAPDLPTFKEAGLPAADYGTFQGMFTTAGSPPATVRRLNEELQKVLAQPDIQQKIAEQGGEVMAGKPDDLKNWLHASIKSFGAEIKAANIKVEQ